MVIMLFKAQTTKILKEEKRLSNCDVMIFIKNSLILNNNKAVTLSSLKVLKS